MQDNDFVLKLKMYLVAAVTSTVILLLLCLATVAGSEYVGLEVAKSIAWAVALSWCLMVVMFLFHTAKFFFVVSKMFSMWGGFVLTTLAGIFSCLYYHVTDFFGLGMFVSAGWFFYGKHVYAFHFIRGQGVHTAFRLHESGEKNLDYYAMALFKMPARYVPFALLIPSIIYFLLYWTSKIDFGHPQTNANIMAFFWIVTLAVTFALMHWLLHWRDYFFASEYNVRVDLKANGNSAEAIEQKIKTLRDVGVFGVEDDEPCGQKAITS